MRDLSETMAEALAESSAYVALLAEFEFDSDTLRMWSGIGTITWNGLDYTGGGNLIGISPVRETQNLQAAGVVFELSGVPSSMLSIALQEQYRGRPCRLYLGLVLTRAALTLEDGNYILLEDGSRILLENQLASSPYRVFSGLMDKMQISDNGQTSTIRLSAESVLTLLKRSKERRYTDEDQKARYPNDRGLEMIAQLQDKEIVW